MDRVLSAILAPTENVAQREAIATTLSLYPKHLLSLCAENDVKVCALTRGRLYHEASPALARLGINVDSWPAPPAGLFVVEERTIYARSLSVMTISHEFGHAIDCALGGGIYLSGTDVSIREAYMQATRFITPYAATGCDEYFAEGVRAMIEANDPGSHWPKATRARLRTTDSALYAILSRIFTAREEGSNSAA